MEYRARPSGTASQHRASRSPPPPLPPTCLLSLPSRVFCCSVAVCGSFLRRFLSLDTDLLCLSFVSSLLPPLLPNNPLRQPRVPPQCLLWWQSVHNSPSIHDVGEQGIWVILSWRSQVCAHMHTLLRSLFRHVHAIKAEHQACSSDFSPSAWAPRPLCSTNN